MSGLIVDELGRIPMSPFLAGTLSRAAGYADAQGHSQVSIEHLLLALAEDPEATVVLKSSNIDIARLATDVSGYLGRLDGRVSTGGPRDVSISADLKKILEAAAAAASHGRRREINGAIVLAAIVGDGKSAAAHMLRAQGLTFEEAIRALQRAQSAPAPSSADDILASARERVQSRTGGGPAPQAPPALAKTAQIPATSGVPASPLPNYLPPESAGVENQPVFSGQDGVPASGNTLSTHSIEPQWEQAAPPRPEPQPAPPHPQQSSAPAPVVAPAPIPAPPPAALRERILPAPSVEYSPLPIPPQPQRWVPPSQPPPIETAAPPRPVGRAPPPLPPAAQGGYAGPPPFPAPQQPPPVRSLPPAAPPWSEAAGQRPVRRPEGIGAAAEPPRQRFQRQPPELPVERSAQPLPRRVPGPAIQAGQLVENIPRRMRVAVPVIVEARVARANVKAIADGMQGGGPAHRHEVMVSKAMSVRLRAPDGGFTIETASPETQWIDNVLGVMSDDYASWRWAVTARERGKRRLQLIVSARTVGADGLTAETALPDQVVEVRVGINYAKTAASWGGWLGAAILGGLLARFGEDAYVLGRALAEKVMGG